MIFKNVIVVECTDGDWVGLYLQEGEMYTLWTEGHSLSVHDWVELINHHHINEVIQKEVDSDTYLSDAGNFPNNYEDIPQEAFV